MATLAPQCLQCKKRRVKCDSAKPTCSRCDRDGHECPGYTKSLKWVHVKPKKPKARRKPSICKAPASASPSGSSSVTDTTLELATRGRRQGLRSLPNPEFVLITASESRIHTVLDSVFYYNADICRDLSAVHWLGKQAIDVHEWLRVPTTFQNMIIVSVLSAKALRYGHDTKGMYSYRGVVIKDMAAYLRAPKALPPEMSIWLLMSMLSLEVYLSPVKDFKIHLDAARLAITSLGGVETCMRQWPAAGDMASIFILTDITSTTTTAVSCLEPEHVTMQSGYLYALDKFEDYLLDSCFPCPVTIFEAIVSINNLRLQSSTAGDIDSPWQAEILNVLEDIQSFNPWQWATQLDCIPDDCSESDRVEAANEWATLASCYQSSTVIYLIESMRSQGLANTTNLEQMGTAIANEAWKQLQNDLRYLHTTFPLRQATPTKPCLWRFCLWPLVVYGYGSVALPDPDCRDISIIGNRSGTSTLFDELRELGRHLASRSLLHGADLFEKLSKRTNPPTWDEAFATSGVFYM